MKRIFRLGLLLVALLSIGTLHGIDRSTYDEIAFNAQHSSREDVRQAFQLLREEGILAVRTVTGRQEADRNPAPDGDIRVEVKESFLQGIMIREMLNQQLPKEVKQFTLAFTNSAIACRGRLDGPLFVNPRFECSVDFVFVDKNRFRMRISQLQVMGIESSLFDSILTSYLDAALKRIFWAGCTLSPAKRENGMISFEVTINPEGFIAGLGKKAYLSGFDMSNKLIRLSFTMTK